MYLVFTNLVFINMVLTNVVPTNLIPAVPTNAVPTDPTFANALEIVQMGDPMYNLIVLSNSTHLLDQAMALLFQKDVLFEIRLHWLAEWSKIYFEGACLIHTSLFMILAYTWFVCLLSLYKIRMNQIRMSKVISGLRIWENTRAKELSNKNCMR